MVTLIILLKLHDKLIIKYTKYRALDKWMHKHLGENHGAEDILIVPIYMAYIIIFSLIMINITNKW